MLFEEEGLATMGIEKGDASERYLEAPYQILNLMIKIGKLKKICTRMSVITRQSKIVLHHRYETTFQ